MRRIIGTLFKIILLTLTAFFTTVGLIFVILILSKPQFLSDQIGNFFIPEPQNDLIELKGIGILGDSQSDEYRADDNRGSNYADSTYNWVEIVAQERNLNIGTWSYYEEPRRQGFEYNFARSGAIAQTMIDQGQHTGLAEYVRSGAVNVVILFVGANDYAPYLYDNSYGAIYSGSMSDDEIIDKRNKIVANIKTAVETLLAAGDPKIFIVTIPDWGDHTAIKVGFPLPHQRLRVTNAIRDTNNSIQELSTLYAVEIIDIQSFYKGLRTSENGYQVVVGTVTLDQYVSQNNPQSAFLRDGVHTGTVINGLLANHVLKTVNEHLFEPIEILSSDEILKIAGIEK